MKATTFAVENIPLIKPGDDIARILTEKTEVKEHDIVVVSSTIVSKSEGRIISLDDVKTTEKAEIIAKRNGNDPRSVQAVIDESDEILLESPYLLVRTKNGGIYFNAGMDCSNIEGSNNRLLLPEDPDESARQIKETIFKYTGKKVSVIITDTNSRPFRIGQTGAAIGIAGIKPTRDWRGTKDLFGRLIEGKNEAVVDELASFANILIGEGSGGTPVVIIRGLNLYHETYGIRELFTPEKEDVFCQLLALFRLFNAHLL
ncbi:coenzyme F420-0:L-glutamate ligase / coenzyme F420-1:gamma-L-glutamate ligase [Methylococcales bacterium]|nr:coenzyme F420-0:L-glutamate ligase / coenzyme F420-1:gamma-L-glutamate ligase [Methylococcales bacterium]